MHTTIHKHKTFHEKMNQYKAEKRAVKDRNPDTNRANTRGDRQSATQPETHAQFCEREMLRLNNLQIEIETERDRLRQQLKDAEDAITKIANYLGSITQGSDCDRFRAFIKRWQEVIVGGDNPNRLEGWAQDFNNEAEAVLK